MHFLSLSRTIFLLFYDIRLIVLWDPQKTTFLYFTHVSSSTRKCPFFLYLYIRSNLFGNMTSGSYLMSYNYETVFILYLEAFAYS